MLINTLYIAPVGGWWSSKGVGGPNRWHYIEKLRNGGGRWWTLCEKFWTENKPNTLRESVPVGARGCKRCSLRFDARAT